LKVPGDGDLEISESDAAGLDTDDRAVATGEVGTELRPLEFPACDGSSLKLFPSLDLFLFPNMEVATELGLSSFRESTPESASLSSAPTPTRILSSSLLSSCLINFRTFQDEWPSFLASTIVSASESLFKSKSSVGPFGRSKSIGSDCGRAGGDDLMQIGVLAAVLFTASASTADTEGVALSLAGTSS
jgi:hypothetical protein